LIQASCRGAMVRDQVLLEQCCAIEIQRFARGYMATLQVYESIYKITLVQSIARRKLAMDDATDKMAVIIQLQSILRGFMWRRKLEDLSIAALVIQTGWRSFSCRFNYQLDLLDIIIVQSIWRKKIAAIKTEKLRKKNLDQFAIIIQKHWRAYDCTMNYLHFLADVLIVQSAVRRYLAKKRVHLIRNVSATKIQSVARGAVARRVARRDRAAIAVQKVWRGFVCYADFMFTIADIVVIQALARRLFARRQASCLRADRSTQSAVIIQKNWRRFVGETEYFIMKYEFQAVRTIQCAWRRFWNYSNFIIQLDSAMSIQAAYRYFTQRRTYLHELKNCVVIQNVIRGFLRRRGTVCAARTKRALEGSRLVARREKDSAICIQSLVRGCQIKLAYKLYTSSRRIQKKWRGYFPRLTYTQYMGARRIQMIWRGYTQRHAYVQYMGARRIQTIWRGSFRRQAYVQYMGARRIQKIWRGHIRRQAYVRHVTKCRQFDAACQIQRMWRIFVRRQTNELHRCVCRIQTIWRGFVHRQAYVLHRDVSLIQSSWRSYAARKNYARLRRRILVKTISAALDVQRVWRGDRVRRNQASFTQWVKEIKAQRKAATTIQRAWRGLCCRRVYWEMIESSLLAEAAVDIQRIWRAFAAKEQYWQVLGSCIMLQAVARGSVTRKKLERKERAALLFQSLVRGSRARAELAQRRFIKMLVLSASGESQQRDIQSKQTYTSERWETIVTEQKELNQAARKIQGFFAMVKAEVDREIRAEKKRRKKKKYRKVKSDDKEDDLLENVWLRSIDHKEIAPNSIRSAEEAVAKELRGELRSTIQQPMHGVDLNSHRSVSSRSSPLPKERSSVNGIARVNSGKMTGSNPMYLSSLRLQQVGSKRKDEDMLSEVSAFTGTSSSFRVPPSRAGTLSQREIDDDFDLEEAWIDAEISSAKERRRMSPKKKSHKQSQKPPKRSSSRSRSSSRTRVPPLTREV
jgi:myosin heavy subunit